ncbi:uncharacterized protein MONBRDRAFT_30870 [Monosiga brevicollis MX1]|uniref:CCDC81 HU domain-containing protein n=1 Tax=Monosiga brevicollis TaxID=81824 RepID=A9UPU5_MONBE|nr:uncharacterized protein MONBRDRAFT_30870 [Monosiga brevicollis MX1]EDQ92481.1 predicted protein [Monosiga brevicollis MX1]|eukprot:XP_001742243.1 hypothetical protein [Monosiga brevicollis MX1]
MLSRGKGVSVLSLGTFALGPDVEGGKPIFNLSNSFLSRHPINLEPQAIAATCPVVGLNFTTLSLASGFDRHTIENTVKEVINALSREVKRFDPKGTSLEFYGVGKLSIKATKVRFVFVQEFYDDPQPMKRLHIPRSEFQSRPVTVARLDFDALGLDRPSTTDMRAITPRILGTPTTTEFKTSLGDVIETPQDEAWGSQARSDAGRRRDIKWQSSLVSNRQLPILDQAGPASPPGTASADHRLLSPALESRRRRPITPVDDSDLAATESEQFSKLATRNLNSTIGVVIEDPKGGVDVVNKTAHWDVKKGPLPDLPKQLPVEHHRNRLKREKSPRLTYEEWQQQVQSKGSNPGRRRRHIRDQLDLDPTIRQKQEASLREMDLQLTSMLERQDRKAIALEKKLDEARREAEKRTAVFNKKAAVTKRSTDAELTGDGLGDGNAGQDVFVFRPPTSHSSIRRHNHDLSLDQAAQAATVRLKETLKQRRSFERGQKEQRALAEQLEAMKLEEEERREQQLNSYRAELKRQIEYKRGQEAAAKMAHPRQPVPFDLKHLPATDKNWRPTNSAAGRRAAALGPEMYKEHDALERRMADNARKVYQEQVAFEAERNRKILEEREAERRRDAEIAEAKHKQEISDAQRLRELAAKEQRVLKKEWIAAHKQKLAAEAEEAEHRRLAADVPIKDYMDYLSYVNDGFE